MLGGRTAGRRQRKKRIDTGRCNSPSWMDRTRRRIGIDRLAISPCGYSGKCYDLLCGSQQVVSPFWPGSHCSPASTIPSVGQRCPGGATVNSLPHCCRLIVDLSPGFWTQLDETSRAPRPLHTFPRVHCENVSSVSDVVGFMMYRPPASQVLALRGQQPPDSEQPEVQSWIAPKL